MIESMSHLCLGKVGKREIQKVIFEADNGGPKKSWNDNNLGWIFFSSPWNILVELIDIQAGIDHKNGKTLLYGIVVLPKLKVKTTRLS